MKQLLKFFLHLRTCFSPSREEQSPWVIHASDTATGFVPKSVLMEKNHMNIEKVVITSALKYRIPSQEVSSVFTVTQHPLFWLSSNEFTSYGNSSLIWLKQNSTRIFKGVLAADTDQISKLPNLIIISNEKLQTLGYSFQIIRSQSYFLWAECKKCNCWKQILQFEWQYLKKMRLFRSKEGEKQVAFSCSWLVL